MVVAPRLLDYEGCRGLLHHQKKTRTNKENPGATLGPGPAASEDGVKDNYYVKGFKYKLVPKNKQGTYVQKGSSMPVRKLWG